MCGLVKEMCLHVFHNALGPRVLIMNGYDKEKFDADHYWSLGLRKLIQLQDKHI